MKFYLFVNAHVFISNKTKSRLFGPYAKDMFTYKMFIYNSLVILVLSKKVC